MNHPALWASVLVGSLAIGQAVADTKVTFTEKRGERTYEQTLAIKDGRVRVEVASQFGGYVLFDQRVPHMINVDPARHQHITVNRDNLKGMASKLSAAREQLLAQLEAAPPARREQIKKMMGPMLDWQPNAEPPKADIKKKGKASLAGYDCERVDVYINGNKQSELCLVELTKLGISQADYQTLMAFQTFMTEVADRLPGSGKSALTFGFWNENAKQLPVYIRHLREDNGSQTFTLSAVSTKALDETLFEVPAESQPQAFEPRYQ